MARGFRVSNVRVAGILAMLVDDGYTEDQSKQAEQWILRGDWQFKKINDLEYSDFYKEVDMSKAKTVKTWQQERAELGVPPQGQAFFGDLEVGTKFALFGADFEKASPTLAYEDVPDANMAYQLDRSTVVTLI